MPGTTRSTETRTFVTQARKAHKSQPAPSAPRRPHTFTTHGITVTDDYAWLKDEKWQGGLRHPPTLDADIRTYLEAENGYTDSLLGHTAPLQKKLVAEMRGRIKEDDSSVPAPDGPFAYFRKFREGGQHEIFARMPRDGRDARGAAATPRRCSTVTRSLPATTISSSAQAGIRPTTDCTPGAPTPRA